MGSHHIYGVSPRRRAVLYGCWALVALPLLVSGLALSESALVIAALIVTGVMLPFFILVVRAARLIVTDDGVEVRQLGAALKTSWSNIIGFRLVRGSEGFILEEPMSGRGAKRVAESANVLVRGVSLYDADRRQLLAEQRFVPIEAFAYWLEHGDLRHVIAEHAPQLFSSASSEVAAIPGMQAPPKLSKTRGIILAVFIILLIGLGIAIAMRPLDEQATAFRILEAPLPVLFVYIATHNFLAAARRFRARRYTSCLLWGSMAVIQVFLALAVLGHLVATNVNP